MRAGLLLFLFGLLSVRADGVEIPTWKTKPYPLCGIPDYAYRPTRELSATATEQSFAGVLMETGAPAEVTLPNQPTLLLPTPASKVRYFQLPVYLMKKDHCSISRVAMTIDQEGHYTISFRADQNARLEDDRAEPRFRESTPPNSSIKQVAHLKRNEFHVQFRLLGAALNRETIAPSDLGRPVFDKIELPAFWVERGEPNNYLRRGRLDTGSKYLDKVDRIEVDFSYR